MKIPQIIENNSYFECVFCDLPPLLIASSDSMQVALFYGATLNVWENKK